MAVTIDEMHVDVQEPKSAPGQAPAPGAEPKNVELREAMEMVHTRKLRLRAD